MIHLKDISKRFGKQEVLSHVNWNIDMGERWRISGSSGKGKTTLLRILMGLERPTSGQCIGLENISFSVVFQENRLLKTYNAIENLQFVCTVTYQQAQTWFEGLLSPEDCVRPVDTLSGGMQRRVSIVRAMAAPSDIVILDEPFTGLDEENIIRVSAYIEKHLQGRTMILASHVDTPLFFSTKCLNLE